MAYGSGSTIATDPLGTARTHRFTTILGVTKSTGDSQPGGSGCGPASSQITYDANGNIASRTDFNGNRVCHAYDLTRNLETLRLEGLGTAACPADLAAHAMPAGSPQRKTHTQWHPDWRLETHRAEPGKITTWVYHGQPDPDAGNAILNCAPADALVIDRPIAVLCKKTEQATDDATGQQGFNAYPTGTPRAWRYTYDRYGHVLTEDGPRADVADVTTHDYWPADATCPGAFEGTGRDKGCRGQRMRTTNALGQVTEYRKYNAHGQPEEIVDPNGLVTTLAYDVRQRLIRRAIGGEVSHYRYDPVGQLVELTAPDGSRVSYRYDAAHRLTGLADELGNRIDYSLDAMGNRLREEVRDPLGQLAQTRQRQYDALNRLWRETGARPDEVTEYAYDAQGNLIRATDPLNRVTQRGYDALNRLVQTLQPSPAADQPNPETRYGYDGQDRLIQVSDPRHLVTRYEIDGLGDTQAILSPDTGATRQAQDAAGNLVQRTDAKGQTTTYAYDALNRLTQARFHDGSRHEYGYDQGVNGIGRLTHLAEYDPAGVLVRQTDSAYDPHGRLIAETRSEDGRSATTAYAYDAAGRLAQLTYPSGRLVRYEHDPAGRVSGLATQLPGEAEPRAVVRNVAYQPFGAVTGYTQGNGESRTRDHDADGRLASYTLGGVRHDLGYDAAGQIVSITPAAGAADLYGYDPLGRLEVATLGATLAATLGGSRYAGYTYDPVGNRLSRTLDATTTVNTYAPTSNRIASAAGLPQTFDANGSLLSNGSTALQYDNQGRLIRAGATDYRLDAQGRRVRKRTGPNDTVYHYDSAGHLIAEHAPDGTVRKEYLWLGDIPVAVVGK